MNNQHREAVNAAFRQFAGRDYDFEDNSKNVSNADEPQQINRLPKTLGIEEIPTFIRNKVAEIKEKRDKNKKSCNSL